MKDLLTGLWRLIRYRHPDPAMQMSMGLAIELNAEKYPDDVMIVTREGEWTWSRFNEKTNRLAHFFHAQGVKKGDTVGIMMENTPDMLAVLVAVCKLGAMAGLLNTKLKKSSLSYCIKTLDTRMLILGAESIENTGEIKGELSLQTDRLFFLREENAPAGPEWARDLSGLIENYPEENPPQTGTVEFLSDAYYLFTSGTTGGMPKAAAITHFYWYRAGRAFSQLLLHAKRTDRIFVCLPLYHTAALLIGFGSSVFAGCSFYLSRKFSASRFLQEARQYKTNVFLYIGELCRYLLATERKSDDSDNPIEKCIGNGLRPDIWDEFKQRFGINRVGEYYGATESNIAFLNVFNRDYTFGMALGKLQLVRYDDENNEVERDEQGFCIPVETGETGLMLSQINKIQTFRGYTDKGETRKKIVSNVREEGDSYVNSGDLIKRVDAGFVFGIPHYQFVDRVGDTFRWKGENVATNEIAEIVNRAPGVRMSSIYGVKIPNADGRASMAALIIDEAGFDIETFNTYVEQSIPAYAKPVFVRIMKSFNTTETFKIKNYVLRQEAYDIHKIQDEIYVKLPRGTDYEKLTQDAYNLIMEGTAGY